MREFGEQVRRDCAEELKRDPKARRAAVLRDLASDALFDLGYASE